MTSLYEGGWRQGSVFEAELPLDALILDLLTQGVRRREGRHDRWVVATQNCDLNNADMHDADPSVELRPVFVHDPPQDWGIRSARYRLTEAEHVHTSSPRPMVSPSLLTALVGSGAPRRDPPQDRALAFTTWLGLRYDRPAVPDSLVPLAKKIAETIRLKRNRGFAERVRDVLVQFDDSQDTPRYSLYAVLNDDEDSLAARGWLADIALTVPVELGVADEIEAASASGISFQQIETSYSADVTQLTWRPHDPDAKGAL